MAGVDPRGFGFAECFGGWGVAGPDVVFLDDLEEWSWGCVGVGVDACAASDDGGVEVAVPGWGDGAVVFGAECSGCAFLACPAGFGGGAGGGGDEGAGGGWEAPLPGVGADEFGDGLVGGVFAEWE